MRNLKTMIKTEYEKTLRESKKAVIFSASHVAGKLLILFFTLILMFTFISRSVASITVARVTVSNPQRDRLIYSMSGTGEIVPETEKRLTVLPGYRIAEVYVKAGEEVAAGTVLYAYSMEDLQDKYTSIENEIKKLKLLMAEERIRQQSSEGEVSQTAFITLKQARENLKAAETKLEEAQKDYIHSQNSTKQKLLENKEQEYEAAVESYENLIASQDKQLLLAKRVVEDATTALDQAGGAGIKIEALIKNYKDAVISKDRLAIYLAQEDIFKAFYGGVEAYDKHEAAVYTKATEVMGEERYLWYLQNNILTYEEQVFTLKDELQEAYHSLDASVNSEQNRSTLSEKYNNAVNSYFLCIEEYERQINSLEGYYNKGSIELIKLRRNDKQLKDYLEQISKLAEKGADASVLEKKLINFSYGDQQKEMEQKIKEKTLSLTRAKEDYQLLEKECETARADLQEQNAELEKVINSMKDGTYDYEEALEGTKQAVEAAKEAVRIAKQSVEMNGLTEAVPSDQSSIQISKLVLQSDTIDLEVKKKELDKVEILIKDSGEVKSQEKGVITFVGVEADKTTTGDEMIKLGLGDYIFRAEFDRAEAAYIVAGVTVDIYLTGKSKGVEVEIDKTSFTQNGRSEMTARMPEDEYILGEKAEYKIATRSEQYDLCIPIQALHEDKYGDYVLVTREQEDILGTLLIAERLDVTVIDKSSRTVAVDGAISSKSQVIADSNKYINAGDRIRIDY